MCIVALKYFEKTGWVGVKNRDRNYYPTINIKQSKFTSGVERIIIWDNKTKYSEGTNEFGLSILSSAVATVDDETEKSKVDKSKKKKNTDYMSPDGKTIRKALKEKEPKKALEICIKRQLQGNTIIFNKETAYMLEAAENPEDHKFYIHYKKIPHEETAVRTNHGLWLKWAGYHETKDKSTIEPSKSSRERLRIVNERIKEIKDPEKMLDAISDFDINDDPQLNPLRLDEKDEAMRTTGQLMIIPSQLTLYYRPVWCDVEFDFNKLDSKETKTFFQILSSRPILYSQKESVRRGSTIY